ADRVPASPGADLLPAAPGLCGPGRSGVCRPVISAVALRLTSEAQGLRSLGFFRFPLDISPNRHFARRPQRAKFWLLDGSHWTLSGRPMVVEWLFARAARPQIASQGSLFGSLGSLGKIL